jgi:hypothetical protein
MERDDQALRLSSGPALPEDEQATRQLLQPGLDTVPEAQHKTLTCLVKAGHIWVIGHERSMPPITDAPYVAICKTS